MGFLEQKIVEIEASIDPYGEADDQVMWDAVKAIEKEGYGLEAVRPLLQLFERHPTVYFGSPGYIVQFIEQFETEYEKCLLESLKRTPTISTVWMLNRCINSGGHEERFSVLLKEIAEREDIDSEVRERAREYIEYQSDKTGNK